MPRLHNLKTLTLVASCLLAGIGATSPRAFAPAFAADAVPAAIAAAVADASRPSADKERDADRKPAEVVAFAGMKPGDKVMDILPGGGYFTRIFAKTVGPKGKVYAMVPAEMIKTRATAADAINKLAAEAGYANVAVQSMPLADIKATEPLDIVWTSLNYHDMHNPMLGPVPMGGYNKAVFNALKSGGIYIVIDHAAVVGSGSRDTDSLHRMDPEAAKAEVTGVGFVLVGESDLLQHPADDHTARVFDSGMRGKTDQFILKFRKP